MSKAIVSRGRDPACLSPPNHFKLPHHFMVLMFENMAVVGVLSSKAIELRDNPVTSPAIDRKVSF